jgi:hypothetical protein
MLSTGFPSKNNNNIDVRNNHLFHFQQLSVCSNYMIFMGKVHSLCVILNRLHYRYKICYNLCGNVVKLFLYSVKHNAIKAHGSGGISYALIGGCSI